MKKKYTEKMKTFRMTIQDAYNAVHALEKVAREIGQPKDTKRFGIAPFTEEELASTREPWLDCAKRLWEQIQKFHEHENKKNGKEDNGTYH